MATSDNDERGFELRELGERARRDRDLDAARSYYEEACSLLRDSSNRLKFAHTIRHMGDVCAEQRDWSHAERCFLEALEVYRSHPSPPILDLANAIRAFAALKSETGRHEEARELWTEAGRLYETVGIAAGVEECKRRAGMSGNPV